MKRADFLIIKCKMCNKNTYAIKFDREGYKKGKDLFHEIYEKFPICMTCLGELK